MASKVSELIEGAMAKAHDFEISNVHLDYRDVLKHTRKENDLSFLQSYMLPITCTILAVSSLATWTSQDWPRRMSGLAAWVVCIGFDMMGMPLISLSIAVALAVWTCLPGSFKTLNLPDHSQFIRSLRTLPPGGDGEHEECMICWDNSHPLAELPCKHQECTGCLQLMSEHDQRSCPLCHRTLFSIHDRKIYALTKGNLALATTNVCLTMLSAVKNIQQGEYGLATAAFGMLLANGVHFWVVGYSIWTEGENWWRSPPTKQRSQLRWLMFNFVINLSTTCTTMKNAWDVFD